MIISNDSIHLVKFDIIRGVNEYCNYQLLADAGMIIAKSGRIGSEYIHDAYDGGVKKYNQLINNKKDKGFKEIEFEELKKELTIFTYHYNTNQSSGLLMFDCEIVEKFLQDIINISKHNVKLSIFTDKVSISSNYQTPLGLIPKKIVEKASSILGKIGCLLEKYSYIHQTVPNLISYLGNNLSFADIESAILTEDEVNIYNSEYNDKQLLDLINVYFSLIPTDMPPDEILKMVLKTKIFILKQQEICDLMLNYYSEVELIKNARVPDVSDNDIKVERVIDGDDFDMVYNLYTLNNGSNSNPEIKNIFKIRLGEQDKKFTKKAQAIGNVQSAWHSTQKRNVASILTKGLLLPETLSGYPNNGTYGSGIYFSSSSGKSITYCNDLINSEPNTKTSAYLILASVAAGDYFEPNDQGSYPPVGFDSTWANKDSEVSDILVVYSEEQVRIDYILEIEKD